MVDLAVADNCCLLVLEDNWAVEDNWVVEDSCQEDIDLVVVDWFVRRVADLDLVVVVDWVVRRVADFDHKGVDSGRREAGFGYTVADSGRKEADSGHTEADSGHHMEADSGHMEVDSDRKEADLNRNPVERQKEVGLVLLLLPGCTEFDRNAQCRHVP